jgi:hypothetical protein
LVPACNAGPFKNYNMRKLMSFIVWSCLAMLITNNAYAQAGREPATVSETDSPASVNGITPGRARSLVGVAAGIAGLIIGLRARKRSNTQPGGARSAAMAALALGVVAIVLSVVHLAVIPGGFGTGGGKAGAVVAIVLGLAGVGLGAFALRTKKTA